MRRANAVPARADRCLRLQEKPLESSTSTGLKAFVIRQLRESFDFQYYEIIHTVKDSCLMGRLLNRKLIFEQLLKSHYDSKDAAIKFCSSEET